MYSLRYLILVASVSALSFAVAAWNASAGIFLISLLPAVLLWPVIRSSRVSTVARYVLILVCAAPIYATSIGPFLFVLSLWYGDRFPNWFEPAVLTLFRPHVYVVEQFGIDETVSGYVEDWAEWGIGIYNSVPWNSAVPDAISLIAESLDDFRYGYPNPARNWKRS